MENQKPSVSNQKCEAKTEVYSRVVGYFRPVQNWNEGKKEEFNERETYKINQE